MKVVADQIIRFTTNISAYIGIPPRLALIFSPQRGATQITHDYQWLNRGRNSGTQKPLNRPGLRCPPSSLSPPAFSRLHLWLSPFWYQHSPGAEFAAIRILVSPAGSNCQDSPITSFLASLRKEFRHSPHPSSFPEGLLFDEIFTWVLCFPCFPPRRSKACQPALQFYVSRAPRLFSYHTFFQFSPGGVLYSISR